MVSTGSAGSVDSGVAAASLVRELLEAFTGIDRDAIALDDDLVDQLGLDSVDAIELLVQVERRTGLRFDADEIMAVSTVADLVDRLVDATARAD